MLSAIIYAKDLAAMVDLYQELLDTEILEQGDSFCTMNGGGFSLTIVQIPTELADTFTITTPPRAREDAAIKLSFPVLNLDAARAILRRHGGVDEVEHSRWEWNGTVHLNVVDLEGNVVELTAST